jgi:asparagine synthase (glutamine-hydrolysing)
VCGFAGIARGEPRGVDADVLSRMGGAIRHRGPDGFGYVQTPWFGAVHVRLSIIGIDSGAQPLTNEDGTLVVVFNGEIYNYVELRAELEARGHTFRTRTDTEVLVHGFEEWGEGMLDHLNGEFAFALHDRRDRSVFLARDRFGIRPLFYAVRGGDLHFASEVKALAAGGEVPMEPSPEGLDQVFTFWGARPPRTPFRGIQALEPGSFGSWRNGTLRTRKYYHLRFAEERTEPGNAVEALGELMHDVIRLRMRADVPVGGYLSGGLDSSITCAMAARFSGLPLETFSVGFEAPELDEGSFQRLVAEQVGSVHHARMVTGREIAEVFPRVVRHTETPLVRTAAAPLFLLSALTSDHGIKVVLTGEGADEVFLGYDLFKETRLRHFCLRRPGSSRRPRLFDRIYPYLPDEGRRGDFWQRFFLEAGGPEDPLFSHLPRFQSTSWIKGFYSGDHRDALGDFDAGAELRDGLPDGFESWTPLNRAAWLEFETLLSPYLLCSQGDRMAMGNGVEGRVPFLDHRLFEFSAGLPISSKLRVLREKDILRRWARSVVPPAVEERPKQPYRAPDAPSFMGPDAPEYVEALLEPRALEETGMFEPAAVAGLLRRARSGRASGFRENQAFVAILSTQLWHEAFFTSSWDAQGLALEGADVALEYDTITAP